jgi:hypothetical protein
MLVFFQFIDVGHLFQDHLHDHRHTVMVRHELCLAQLQRGSR